MSAALPEPDRREPPPAVLSIATLVYALHSFAIVVALVGTATVIGSFIGSVPSIAAVILNYVKRGDARGTWVESHYRWQIRTFWFAVLWVALGGLLFVTLVGIPIAFAIFAAITLWVIYRIAKGWMRLNEHRPMYD